MLGAVLRVFGTPKTWSNQGAELGFWAAGEVVGRGLCSAFSALWRAESAGKHGVIRGAESGLQGRSREAGCAPRFRHFGGLKVWSNQGGRTGLLGCRGGGGKRLCSAFSALWRAETAEYME